MATESSHIADLLLRFHRGTLSAGDRQELDAWIAASPANAALYQELTEEQSVRAALREIEQVDEAPVRQRILAQMPGAFGPERGAPVVQMKTRPARWRWAAAAVIFVLLGVGGWWWLQPGQRNTPTVQTVQATDISAPARSRATLTLASGRQVDLDSAGNGALATQGGAQIVKGAGGRLTYQLKVEHPGDLLYNTLSNPRGSQVVTLTLSDGTKVWLNAESSIRYPAVFVGSDRAVEMTGEAYFEVAKNVSQPFKVVIRDREEINVLGTSFNINAYADEPALRTTLLDGSVRVAVAGSDKLRFVLKPGQQALFVGAETSNSKGSLTVDDKADIEQVLAWKNGRFAFNRADLPTVMRQLARWYNVDVSYEGAVPQRQFSGRIGKSLTLDQVLKGLTRARVHYTIETGNRLIIRP
jgi:ferric-dicitrate binding protein FerR (iron transport regulator)